MSNDGKLIGIKAEKNKLFSGNKAPFLNFFYCGGDRKEKVSESEEEVKEDNPEYCRIGV